MKRFLLYFISTVTFIVLVFWGYKLPEMVREELMFEGNSEVLYFLVVIFTFLYPTLIGILIRLPKFIKEVKEKRKWAIDWVKLCAIGIPTLYVSQIIVLYSSLPHSVPLPFSGALMRNIESPLSTIAGIIFGYIVLDSLKEKKRMIFSTTI
ncbi:hypothetical protein GLW08_04270 [Pontibacillus yanchengensis]|uniref:Uncharacterized protein n=2 Tax=Pontibacillus yanchengensis TaxID=462910 RepID=A0A6I5A2R2_9BACI|nr:hypothetical protein [Pontibacillus yanchengensis]MYL35082.1 hypothetical protein [Pontibacillus yanchengensis]MYL52551.1 hypothetical protein [Pontibacillus yanchengensis]